MKFDFSLSLGSAALQAGDGVLAGYGSLKINSQTVRLNGSRVIIPTGAPRG